MKLAFKIIEGIFALFGAMVMAVLAVGIADEGGWNRFWNKVVFKMGVLEDLKGYGL